LSEAEKPKESVGFRRRRERRERAKALLDGKPLIAALDLGKRKHAVCLADRELTLFDRFTVAHSREGLTRFLERARAEQKTRGLDRLVAFMEPTSHFWRNVASFFEENGVTYRTVSPLAVNRSREIEHQTYAKGDYRDAEIIADLGAKGRWLHRQLGRDPLWLQLDALAREHELLLEAEIAERGRVRCYLELAVPEFLESFKEPLGKTACAILRRLTHPASDVPKTFAELVARAEKTEGHRLQRGKLRALVAMLGAAPSYGVESALLPTLARLGPALDRFEFLREQRACVRARLVALYETTSYRKTLDTIPGVGPESHALLLGLIGDPKQYDRATCLAKLPGTEPRENASGEGEGSHSIARRGRSALRWVVHRIVIGLSHSNDQFATYTKRLMSREKNPLKWPQAAVATGNKYLRLVYHMCHEGKPYDPAKLTAPN
jgi:transposase